MASVILLVYPWHSPISNNKMNLVLLLSEMFLLIACLALALLWIVNPKGNFEPFIVYFGALLAIIEFVRRKTGSHTRTKSAPQQEVELFDAPISINDSMDSIKEQLSTLQVAVESYNRSITDANNSNETQNGYQSLDESSHMFTSRATRTNSTGVKIRDKIKTIKIQPDGSALSITSNKGINFLCHNDQLANSFSDTLGLVEQYAYMAWSYFHLLSDSNDKEEKPILWVPLHNFLDQLTGKNQYDIEPREIEKSKITTREEEFESELKAVTGPCFFITKDNFRDLMPNVSDDSAFDVCTIDSPHQTERLHIFIDYPSISHLPIESDIFITAADREGLLKKSRLEIARGNFELNNDEQECIKGKISIVLRRYTHGLTISIANPNPSVVYVIRWKLPNEHNVIKLANADAIYFNHLRTSFGNSENLDTRETIAGITEAICCAFGTEKVHVHLVGRTQNGWELVYGDNSIKDLIMRVSDKALRTRKATFAESLNPWDNNYFNSYLTNCPSSFIALPVLYPRIDPVKWESEYGNQLEKIPPVACVICISLPEKKGVFIKDNMSDVLVGLYSVISANINQVFNTAA